MRAPVPLDTLETALGHAFANREHLVRALTHKSAVPAGAAGESNQRLEFLGDRVLALAVADMLMRAFPNAEEGELAQRLNQLVRRETCAAAASALDLGRYLRLGGGEAGHGGRGKPAILGDAMESVIAAIYLDGGYEAARAFVERHWTALMGEPATALHDAKTTLQEWAQGRGLPTPTYRVVERSGPDHHPQFRVAVDIAGLDSAEGEGRSKREAEQSAAAAALRREGLWKDERG